jgi:hypothetical protein
VSEKPFCFFFDDTRNLYFSYFLNFTDPTTRNMGVHVSEIGKKTFSGFIPAATYKVLDFPHLVTKLIKEESFLKEKFNYLIINENENIPPLYLLKNDSLILDFIKMQVANWSDSNPGHNIYNPTAIVPFIAAHELESIMTFCRENLINLVVFDFINITINKEIVKNFRKETEKYTIQTSAATVSELEPEWDKYFSLGANYFSFYDSVLIKDTEQALQNIININIPQEILQKVKLHYFDQFSSSDKVNLACIYYQQNGRDFFTNLDVKNSCALSIKEFEDLASFMKSNQGNNLDFTLTEWNQWIKASQSWNDSEKKYLLNSLATNNVICDFEFCSIESMYGGNIESLKELNEVLIDYQASYPNLWIKVKKFLILNSHAYSPWLKSASVADFVVFSKLVGQPTFSAQDLVYNPNFVAIVREFGIDRFIGFNKILHLLPFPVLKDFLEIDHNGIKLVTYFSSELPKILDRKSTICKNTYELVLTNTSGQLNADVFIYKLMLGHDYSQLTQALTEPRLKVKPDTKKLMYLNLLKLRQHPEVSKVLELLG